MLTAFIAACLGFAAGVICQPIISKLVNKTAK